MITEWSLNFNSKKKSLDFISHWNTHIIAGFFDDQFLLVNSLISVRRLPAKNSLARPWKGPGWCRAQFLLCHAHLQPLQAPKWTNNWVLGIGRSVFLYNIYTYLPPIYNPFLFVNYSKAAIFGGQLHIRFFGGQWFWFILIHGIQIIYEHDPPNQGFLGSVWVGLGWYPSKMDGLPPKMADDIPHVWPIPRAYLQWLQWDISRCVDIQWFRCMPFFRCILHKNGSSTHFPRFSFWLVLHPMMFL
jgi:hypothetical protein